ncbi:hypothetical protein [Pseudomonas sp. W4I3]|uniref:hypothetical protein n=1 Tax=Pseudomonas sp. W4I3 TaxID=3042294 RepID=UPI00278A28A1|nr:hypothetical protein [Pseudomonas sp. W4I3]MDQ0740595.1 hypothetical protein [Pseudomonas sp. W4I3]
MAEIKETRYSIRYELLGLAFKLTTDNDEMHRYLEDVLEEHLVTSQEEPIDVELFIPLIDLVKRRYLTRTAPDYASVLTDVKFGFGMPPIHNWRSTAPPLIPFNIEAIDGRFSAYHAAAINAAEVGAVLLLGNKGAGKSTNALALCKQQEWSLLSDETCVVRSRDLVVHAILRQPHGYAVDSQNIARKMVLRFADNLWLKTKKEGDPVLAFELIFIPGMVTPHAENVTDEKIAAQILTRHQLQFGGTPEGARECSRALAAKVKLIQIYHGGYENFPEVQKIIVGAANRMFK